MSDSRHVVEFSRFVVEDIGNIVAYLTQQGARDTAHALVDEVLARISTLEEFPRCGNIPRNC